MPTIYLHAVGLDKELWSGSLTGEDIALDFPGFGSEPSVEPISMAILADNVARKLDRPHDVVGLSLGAMVTQHLALRHPEVVRSVIVACGGPETSREVSLQRARDTRAGGMASVLESTLDRWFTPAALADANHHGVEYARRRLLADDAEIFARYWEAMAEHDLTERLAEIAVPATVIAGSNDRAVNLAVMKDMAERIPNAKLEIVDGPHMLPLENREGFNLAVRRHLEWVASK